MKIVHKNQKVVQVQNLSGPNTDQPTDKNNNLLTVQLNKLITQRQTQHIMLLMDHSAVCLNPNVTSK